MNSAGIRNASLFQSSYLFQHQNHHDNIEKGVPFEREFTGERLATDLPSSPYFHLFNLPAINSHLILIPNLRLVIFPVNVEPELLIITMELLPTALDDMPESVLPFSALICDYDLEMSF
jgi:hypothetical protein